ncbi:uncharacterized protein METZ01_LOCUS431305 [marine metagenome]|uniref:AMIN domain-containing protein n=1 Tax=marine metagenome TaxID=408172 RepID=A0A382Y6M6_9ZZZZ
MNLLKKNGLVIFLLITAMVITTGMQEQVHGQEAAGTAQDKQIYRIKIGPHPKYTRLLLDISGPVEY